MEDFNKKLDELKRQVIFEIEQILPEGKSHQYTDTFYCTMIDGDCAVRTISDIIKNENGSIKLVTVSDTIPPEQETYDDLLSTYEIETIIYAYEQLRKELRAHKIERIKELVEQAGGKVEIGCEFTFRHKVDGKWTESGLKCVEVGNNDVNGKTVDALWFDCYRNGNEYEQSDSQFPDEGLDSLIAFIEQKVGMFDISLTNEQKDAVEQLKVALENVKKAGIVTIREEYDHDIYFVNGNGFEYACDWEGIPAGYISVHNQLEKVPFISIGDYFYNSMNNEEIIAKRI